MCFATRILGLWQRIQVQSVRDCFQWEERGKMPALAALRSWAAPVVTATEGDVCCKRKGSRNLSERLKTEGGTEEEKKLVPGEMWQQSLTHEEGRRRQLCLRTCISCHIHLSPGEDTLLQHGANNAAVLTLDPPIPCGVKRVPTYPMRQASAVWNTASGYSEPVAGTPRVSVTSQRAWIAHGDQQDSERWLQPSWLPGKNVCSAHTTQLAGHVVSSWPQWSLLARTSLFVALHECYRKCRSCFFLKHLCCTAVRT